MGRAPLVVGASPHGNLDPEETSLADVDTPTHREVGASDLGERRLEE